MIKQINTQSIIIKKTRTKTQKMQLLSLLPVSFPLTFDSFYSPDFPRHLLFLGEGKRREGEEREERRSVKRKRGRKWGTMDKEEKGK